MKLAARIATLVALAIALSAPLSVSAAPTLPEVAVHVYAAPDGFQMDWLGPNTVEPGEEWCANTQCVNETLTKIGQEWTYSVTWHQV